MCRSLVIAAAVLASAVSLGATDDPRVKALYGEVIAPCCWSQPVSVHQSPAAEEVRTFITLQVREGRSDQEIKDALVAQYGARVLARPPARGFAWTLYVGPWVALIGSGIGLSLLVRRLAHRRPSAATPSAAATPELDERLDDELRDLD